MIQAARGGKSMNDIEKARAHFRTAKNRLRRQEQIKADKLLYDRNSAEITVVKKAAFIIGYMTRVYQPASNLEITDILDKIKTREELEFYYRWCCRPC